MIEVHCNNKHLLTSEEMLDARRKAWESLYPEHDYPSDEFPPDGVVEWRLPIEVECDTEYYFMLLAQHEKSSRSASGGVTQEGKMELKLINHAEYIVGDTVRFRALKQAQAKLTQKDTLRQVVEMFDKAKRIAERNAHLYPNIEYRFLLQDKVIDQLREASK